jgi:hypothetical protein
MYISKITYQLSSVVLSCLGLFCCFGQDNPALKEFDNRFEGSTTELISGSANLQLISLVSYFQDFDWFRGQQLKIRFHLEEIKPVDILAQQTKGNIIYRMKPKEFTKVQGINEFGPWPVDDMLSSLELTKNNLGITITDSSRSVYYPATIYHSSDSLNFRNYLFHFLPGKSLTKINFLLYKGLYKDREIDEDSMLYSRDLGDRNKYGGEPFQLFLEKEDFDLDSGWEGWMTLTMRAKNYDDYSNVEAIYFFYHTPDYKQSD